MIRRLDETDLEVLIAIRREALVTDPRSFTASPGSDPGLDHEFVRASMAEKSTQAYLGAFDPDLIGMAGVYRYSKEKERHRAGVWGMYVRPSHRGRGHGSALLAAAIDFGRSLSGVTHLCLCVSETADAAMHLYERFGFITWGREPAALKVDGVLVDVRHMVLALNEERRKTDFRPRGAGAGGSPNFGPGA